MGDAFLHIFSFSHFLPCTSFIAVLYPSSEWKTCTIIACHGINDIKRQGSCTAVVYSLYQKYFVSPAPISDCILREMYRFVQRWIINLNHGAASTLCTLSKDCPRVQWVLELCHAAATSCKPCSECMNWPKVMFSCDKEGIERRLHRVEVPPIPCNKVCPQNEARGVISYIRASTRLYE
jgi:hypothetical protein